MEYTKGEWKVRTGMTPNPVSKTYLGIVGDKVVALIAESWEGAEANAHLIVAAVNACAKINPDNPQTVAESISDLYEALKQLTMVYEINEVSVALRDLHDYPVSWTNALKAIAKAEGG